MNNHSKHELMEEGIPLQSITLSHPSSLAFFPDGWRQMSSPPLLQRSMTGTGTLSLDPTVCKWRRTATWKPLAQSRWCIMPHRDGHEHTAQHQDSKRHKPGDEHSLSTYQVISWVFSTYYLIHSLQPISETRNGQWRSESWFVQEYMTSSWWRTIQVQPTFTAPCERHG